MNTSRKSVAGLGWQSQVPLFLTVALGGAGIAIECLALSSSDVTTVVQAFTFGAFLALLTWRARAATPGAALTGGLCTTALYLATPGWRTALWPLLALLLLTLAATRFGAAQKERLGVAEGRRGRTASQVAANLGIAVLASLPLGLASAGAAHGTIHAAVHAAGMKMALAAALAEAAADTLSSEVGEVVGGEPRLLITLRRVPAGTDGAISGAGTAAGCGAAVMVSAAASLGMGIAPGHAALVALAAIAGLFTDSLLGAVLERRGWMNNDAVNFLSTLAAASLAASLAGA